MAEKKAQPRVKHLLRTFSAETAARVEEELTAYLDAGYALQATHYTGEVQGALRVLYILVK